MNQINNNDPPGTRIIYDRLRKPGNSDFETRQLIGQYIAIEMYHVLKDKQLSDEKRFIRHLNQLPEEPFEDQVKKKLLENYSPGDFMSPGE